VSERSERCFSAVENPAVWFNKVHSCLEPCPRQFGISFGKAGVLKRNVFNIITSRVLPAMHPNTAEIAVPVKDEQGLFRRGADTNVQSHAPFIALALWLRQPEPPKSAPLLAALVAR